jgi:hypothetical protein
MPPSLLSAVIFLDDGRPLRRPANRMDFFDRRVRAASAASRQRTLVAKSSGCKHEASGQHHKCAGRDVIVDREYFALREERPEGRRLRAPIGKHQFTRRRIVAHLEQVLNFRVT